METIFGIALFLSLVGLALLAFSRAARRNKIQVELDVDAQRRRIEEYQRRRAP
jgi:hypothetical protein